MKLIGDQQGEDSPSHAGTTVGKPDAHAQAALPTPPSPKPAPLPHPRSTHTSTGNIDAWSSCDAEEEYLPRNLGRNMASAE